MAGTQIDLTALGTSGLAASNNTAAIYQNLFPSSRFETAGAPGKGWVEVELRQTNNVASSGILDGTVVAQRTNTSVFTAGDIMLGFMDPFSSIANPPEDAFVLFDNVRVEDLNAAALQPPGITSQPATPDRQRRVAMRRSRSAPAARIPSTYQWRFNGTNLGGATNSSLSLTNVQAANAGIYDVVVSNARGPGCERPGDARGELCPRSSSSRPQVSPTARRNSCSPACRARIISYRLPPTWWTGRRSPCSPPATAS